MVGSEQNPNLDETILRGSILSRMTKLVGLGIASTVGYYIIASVSSLFELDNPGVSRPILPVLGLFAVLFCIYLFAMLLIAKNESLQTESPKLIFILFTFGLLFRVLFIFSEPIQEVDIYRYIWDGQVVAAGHNPYEFPPQAILHPEIETGVDLPDTEGLTEVAQNIHFANLSTPYPPVSQAVFTFTAWITPDSASARDYLLPMKTVLVLFDIGIAFAILFLLKLTAKPLSLFVAYWWCPLAVKEIANSGHLDSIAIFFCIMSLALLAKSRAVSGKMRVVFAAASAIAISLGIAAKVFPVFLLPLWILYAMKAHRWNVLLLTFLVFALTSVLMWPMLKHTSYVQKHFFQNEATADTGIEAFYNYWEINDLAFMSVVENLKPDETIQQHQRAWFVVTSPEFRKSITSWYASKTDTPISQCAFRITRFAMLALVALLGVWFCLSFWRNPNDKNWLRMCFLTLAWYWLLSPTQNPWYWLWALPLIPLSKIEHGICLVGSCFFTT